MLFRFGILLCYGPVMGSAALCHSVGVLGCARRWSSVCIYVLICFGDLKFHFIFCAVLCTEPSVQ